MYNQLKQSFMDSVAITETCPYNMQRFISALKFDRKISDIFYMFAQNIDCEYTLEPPGENPESMFWIKNTKNRYTPVYPSCTKVGFMGVYITGTCFPDGNVTAFFFFSFFFFYLFSVFKCLIICSLDLWF